MKQFQTVKQHPDNGPARSLPQIFGAADGRGRAWAGCRLGYGSLGE